MTMGPASGTRAPDVAPTMRAFIKLMPTVSVCTASTWPSSPFSSREQVGVFGRIFFQFLPDGLVDHLGGQATCPGIPPTLGSWGT